MPTVECRVHPFLQHDPEQTEHPLLGAGGVVVPKHSLLEILGHLLDGSPGFFPPHGHAGDVEGGPLSRSDNAEQGLPLTGARGHRGGESNHLGTGSVGHQKAPERKATPVRPYSPCTEARTTA